MIGRRQVLAGLAAGLAGGAAMAGLSGPALAAVRTGLRAGWPMRSGFRDIDQRHLWVRQTGGRAGGEVLHTRFRGGDAAPDWAGVEALSWLFRDWKGGDRGVMMNIRLFDLLATIQTLLTLVENRPLEIVLTSGYRTPERNATLEGAAVHSEHIYGRAADITIPGIPGARVREAAELAGASGIGAYAHFTHVDVGGKGRRWHG